MQHHLHVEQYQTHPDCGHKLVTCSASTLAGRVSHSTSASAQPPCLHALQKAVAESCVSQTLLALCAFQACIRASSTEVPASKELGRLSCMEELLSMLSLQQSQSRIRYTSTYNCHSKDHATEIDTAKPLVRKAPGSHHHDTSLTTLLSEHGFTLACEAQAPDQMLLWHTSWACWSPCCPCAACSKYPQACLNP